MKLKQDYSDLIDIRNEKFLKHIDEKEIKIELYEIHTLNTPGSNKQWRCTFRGDSFEITFHAGNRNIESFTHELLHVYMASLGFHDVCDFINIIHASKHNLSDFFLNELLAHINNIFAHKKMYGEYITSGFNEELFTCDYNSTFMTYKNEIEMQFHTKEVPNLGIIYFLGTFFSAMDFKGERQKSAIEEHLIFLNTLDKNLYSILENAWKKWVDEVDVSRNKEILTSMITELDDWYSKRKKTV